MHLLEPRYRTATPITADTMDELADKIGVSKTQFLVTIDTFNKATSPGKFNPFELDGLNTGDKLTIPKSNWALPLDQPPFVAYGVTCGKLCSPLILQQLHVNTTKQLTLTSAL